MVRAAVIALALALAAAWGVPGRSSRAPRSATGSTMRLSDLNGRDAHEHGLDPKTAAASDPTGPAPCPGSPRRWNAPSRSLWLVAVETAVTAQLL
jgi:hypothetical protein